jgi:glucose-6-phosphate 1-epimerase
MASIDDLNRSFSVDGAARFEPGQGGLARLALNTALGSAHIYLHGAHVTHYQPAGQPAALFLSSKAFFEPGRAIRGGIPICWPWFGPRESDKAAMHGFVRTRPWSVAEVTRSGEVVRAVFTFASSPETRAIWDHDFNLRFIVTLGSQLTTELEVRNTSPAEFTYEEALHTYFAVADVRQIAIEGLAGSTFIDKIGPEPQRKVDHDNALRITGQTDRVYVNTPAACTVEDPVLKRRIVVAKDNSHSTVVWNPWSDRGGSFTDLGLEEWPKFVCVESCNVKDNALTLKPGATNMMRVRLRSEAM